MAKMTRQSPHGINLMNFHFLIKLTILYFLRYLLYDVNPSEGFNLRRDVYLRMAVLVAHLRTFQPWTLVFNIFIF